MATENSKRLLKWVENNLFINDQNVLETMPQLAQRASAELALRITEKIISEAVLVISRNKNYDLERYAFS